MIKYYFFILLFLSFSLLSAQEKLTKEERIRREKNIKAGNPFVKYGCKAPVATLSKGKYLEVHDLDSIVIIGTTRWHVYKKIIVGEIKIDSLNLDAQPTGDVPGMWMSPDPLSEEYPSWNPYNYCFNNPINLIDPTGMGPWEPEIKDNKIVAKAEAGDDAKSLAKFLNVDQKTADKLYASKDKSGTVKLTNDVPGVETINAAIQHVADHKNDGFYKNDNHLFGLDANYCCFDSSFALLSGGEIDYNSPFSMMGGFELTSYLKRPDQYMDVTNDPSQYKFGETLIRYGDKNGNTVHAATYLGTSKDGTIYTWSKEGNINPPTIKTTTQSQKDWGGRVQGVGSGKKGGFFNRLY